MGGSGRVIVAALTAGWLVASAAQIAANERGISYRRLVGEGAEASSVRAAVQGAQRRLAQEGCSAILQEFSDASGRTLQQNLEALALTPSEYLDVVVFYDAQGTGRCRSLKVLAMTTPGSRAVGVCGARFAAARRHDRRHTEVVLIHETLHTLGLGENPPTSGEITSRVLARCGN